MCKLISLGSQSYTASLLTRQGPAVYPEGQWSTDQSRSEVAAEHPCSRDELAQQLFKTENLLRPGWARPRRPWLPLAPSSVLEHVMRAGGRWDALTDLRSERQLESEISRTEAAIATPLAIFPIQRC